MQKAAENAEWLGGEVSAAIVVAAHPPKGPATKGHSLKAFTISGAGELENISQALWFINPQSAKHPNKDHIALECGRIKGTGEGTRLALHRKVVPISGLDIFDKPRTSVVLERDKANAAPQVSTTPAPLAPDVLARIAELHGQGMGRDAIAKEVGLSSWTVRQAL
jgi:hypothetical protein